MLCRVDFVALVCAHRLLPDPPWRSEDPGAVDCVCGWTQPKDTDDPWVPWAAHLAAALGRRTRGFGGVRRLWAKYRYRRPRQPETPIDIDNRVDIDGHKFALVNVHPESVCAGGRVRSIIPRIITCGRGRSRGVSGCSNATASITVRILIRTSSRIGDISALNSWRHTIATAVAARKAEQLTEVIAASVSDVESAIRNCLGRLGCAYADLVGMHAKGEYPTIQHRLAWVAYGGFPDIGAKVDERIARKGHEPEHRTSTRRTCS